jgi:nicotinamidase-related amidase
MASPHFKPDNCALVLIDHQVGTIQLIKNVTSDSSVRNAVNLGKAALAFKMPIVMTTSQEERVQGVTAEALQRALPEAYEKRVKRVGIVNAWDDPRFKKAVEDTGRRQLIIAAVTTDICLVFPTISAVEAGFEVQAVLDASGSSFDIGEETSRRRMERAGVWLTSTNTMIAELVHDWTTPQGMKLIPLISADPPMLPA